MFSSFHKRQDTMLGVDIDSLSLSLLELASDGNTFCLRAYAREMLPQNEQTTKSAETEDAIDIEIQSQCLERLIKKGKFSTKKAVSAVSSSNIITKHLVMDESLDETEIENQIILEAERIIPYSIDDVAIDFEVLGKNNTDDTKVDVLLVACRRQMVDDREHLLTLSGLQPQVIDVTTYAMERAYPLIAPQLPLRETDNVVALIHIGDQFTTLNVLKDGNSIHVGSHPFGGRQLVDRLCQREGRSFNEALTHYVQQKFPSASDKKILTTFHAQCTGYINRLLEHFYSTQHVSLVDHVVLSGSIASMELLQKKTESSVNAPCSVANPFSGVELPSSVDAEHLNQMAPALFVACGLAMREAL